MICHSKFSLLLWVFFSHGGYTYLCASIISWSSCLFEVLSFITMSLTLVSSSSSSCTLLEWICLYIFKVSSSSKVTSMPILIFLNHGTYNLYAFKVSLHLINILFFHEGSNLFLFSLRICIYIGYQTILIWLTYGFSPRNNSYGLVFSSTWFIVLIMI